MVDGSRDLIADTPMRNSVKINGQMRGCEWPFHPIISGYLMYYLSVVFLSFPLFVGGDVRS